MERLSTNIRGMQTPDLDFATECTLSEGWLSETRREIVGFFENNAKGCFVAESNGKRIGICIATHYGESGFVGELIVAKERRGQGIGHKLLEHAVNYLTTSGASSVYLDGVPAAVPLYERIGFRKVCRSLRFAGRIQGKPSPLMRQMQLKDLAVVLEIDRRAFGADRGFFLRRRLTLYPELCRVVNKNRNVAGFALGRRGQGLVSIGPLVGEQAGVNPAMLLEDIALYAGAVDLRLGILETNTVAVKTAKSLGFAELPNPPWRMVLGSSSNLGASNQCFAIGSPAKG
jgi:ribosomal protein S18 acetylase RimI-like enzyme